jgi:hypothetical protein
LYILPIGGHFISVVLPSGVLLKNGNSSYSISVLEYYIYYSFYLSIMSIYWWMSFMSYSKSYYWGYTCRMIKIVVNKTKTDSVRVLTYPNWYMYISPHVFELIFHIKILFLYIPVKICTKWWSSTNVKLRRETLSTNETQSVSWECYQSKLLHLYLNNTFFWHYTIVHTVDYFKESTVYSFVLAYINFYFF